jgi:ABC-type transport system substrate-binding protein
MEANYWSKLGQRRLSRRGTLQLTSGAVVTAAFLAACGGDDDDSQGGTEASTGGTGASTGGTGASTGGTGASTGGTGASTGGTGAASGLVTQAQDESANVKRGGELVNRSTTEPNTLEPHLFPGNFTAQDTYSGMWRIKDGLINYSSGEIEGDVFESWEFSADKLTITAKVNPNAHFSPVAPVDGRAVDAEDIVATFERHKSVSNQRAEFANEINPNAPIISVSASDSQTVVIQLNQPNAAITALLARGTPGSMFVVPKESLDPGVLDLAKTSAGSGPWYITDYNFGIGYRYLPNPGFGQDEEDIPYVDSINWPTLTEYASFLAQVRTGSLHLAVGIRGEDVLSTKRDLPELELLPTYYTTRIQRPGFGMAPDSPFVDERLRQAWMMTIDRDLYLDTVFNLSNYADAGLPVDVIWESGVQSDMYGGWVLNARDEAEFGPNAKYFKYDLAEATKLVEAAGHQVPMPAELYLPARQAVRNVSYWDGLEALYNMTIESGVFDVNLNLLANYDADWVPKYHNQSRGPFSGVTVSLSALAQDPATYLRAYYGSNGALRQGTDSTMDDLTAKMIQEFDTEKRKELGFEIQRYEGQKMFYPRIGGATGFSLGWPAVRNREVFRGGTMRRYTTLWLDQEKQPF